LLHEEYIGKMKGMQHVHFAAMEPILACIKQEIRQSKQECAEGMIKIEPLTKKVQILMLNFGQPNPWVRAILSLKNVDSFQRLATS